MAEPLIEQLRRDYDRASTIRRHYEPTWQEIYDYTMPGRQGFWMRAKGERGDDLIFDETAVVGVSEFANRLQSGIAPSGRRWARMKVGEEIRDPRDRREIQTGLDQVNNLIFQELNASNFASEFNENCRDLSVGWAVLRFVDTFEGFKFKAVPQTRVYLMVDSQGNIDREFISHKMQPHEIKSMWPKATIPDRASHSDKTGGYDVIECIRKKHTNMFRSEWEHVVFMKGDDTLIWRRQYNSRPDVPVIVFRWSTVAGENYGRGPAWEALSAIKTCNLTVQLMLENAEMSIAGMWQQEDDGITNPETLRFEPGTILSYARGTAGFQPLTPGGRFDVSELVLADQRHNIRKALFNETLGPREGTPPSATEVAERLRELSNMIGPVLDRILFEALFPIYHRAAHLLRQRGAIDLPRIDGKLIQLYPRSPLAEAAEMGRVTNIDRFAEQVIGRFGPGALQSKMEIEDTIDELAELWNVPAHLIRSTPQARAMAAQAAQLTAAVQEAPPGTQAA